MTGNRAKIWAGIEKSLVEVYITETVACRSTGYEIKWEMSDRERS